MALYIITDIQTGETETIALDSDDFYFMVEVIRNRNKSEIRFTFEAIEQNKPLGV